MEAATSFFHLTPHGLLRDGAGAFDGGNGPGLLALIRAEPPAAPEARFFHRLFSNHVGRLAAAAEPADGDLSPVFDAIRPTAAENAFAVLSAPPMTGGEYFDAARLGTFYREFEEAFRVAFLAHGGALPEFIRSLSAVWRDVGKVSFHLAENKNDPSGEYPFAFLASFVHRADGDRPKHLPLGTALKVCAGDSRALPALLAPIEQAAADSEVIRELLESRRIFQPARWSSREAYRFLRDIPVFERANIVVRIVNLWRNAPSRPQLTVTLDLAKQKSAFGTAALLDFKVETTLDGEALTPEELKMLLDSEGGLIRLKGRWVVAEPEKIAGLLAEWSRAEALARTDGLSMAAGLRLLAGVDGELQVRGDDAELCRFEASGEFRRLLGELRAPAGIALPALPPELARILRPYQLDGVKYLWRTSAAGFGSCLADDMGLGKTLQMLALLTLWKQEGELNELPALLVLPATLLANWQSESARFAPDLKLAVIHPSVMSGEEGSAFAADPRTYLSRFDLALVTYGMLPRLPALLGLEFPAVIADEAQAIRNPATKQSRVLRGLRGRHRLALTGTPVENRLADLWSIFDFINPGLLGNLKKFLAFAGRLEGNYAPLRQLTQPFILRRLKSDRRIIADLPDKTELKVHCRLSRSQAALYRRCVEEMKQLLWQEEEGIRRRGVVLAYLMRFKQICNHPAQFLGDGDFAPERSGKFDRLAELVEPIADRQEKMLLFTQFRELAEPLHDHLRRCFGRDGLVLHGGTPVKARAELVRAFQEEDGPPFFVLSLKAAGTGLNLTAASHVVHFDRWWNPAVENQASDRAYRIGQKRNVLVHKFICRGTLEEKIDELIASKQQLADGLLAGGAEKLLTAMSDEELLSLVRLDLNQTGEA